MVECVVSHRQAGDQSIDDGELADKAGHRFRAEEEWQLFSVIRPPPKKHPISYRLKADVYWL